MEKYTLKIIFENGEKGTADFSGYAKRGGCKNFADLEYLSSRASRTSFGQFPARRTGNNFLLEEKKIEAVFIER